MFLGVQTSKDRQFELKSESQMHSFTRFGVSFNLDKKNLFSDTVFVTKLADLLSTHLN